MLPAEQKKRQTKQHRALEQGYNYKPKLNSNLCLTINQ